MSIKNLPWIIIVILLLTIYLLPTKKEIEVVEKRVPINKIVEVPRYISVSDTVYVPKPYKVKEGSKDLLEAYKKLEDEKQKLEVYKNSIKLREYSVDFIDTVQNVTVHTSVRGFLTNQSIEYEIFPKKVLVQDTVNVKIPLEQKSFISAGVEVGVPLINRDNLIDNSSVLKANLSFTSKKKNSLSIGLDTQGRFWIGKNYKF